LLPLARYLGILADQYPKPISQKDLAAHAGVTEAAVSKLRDRVYEFCDLKVLARQRKLVLRTDSKAATEILVAFVLSTKLRLFLKSPYGAALARMWVHRSYGELTRRVDDLTPFFSEEDALFLLQILAMALAENVDKLDLSSVDALDPNQAQVTLTRHVVTIMNRIGPSLQRQIKDVPTLRKILIVRDHAWYVFLRLVETKLETVFKDFMDQLPDLTTREAYLKVYQQTVVFYAKRALDQLVTAKVGDAATRNKVKFDPEELEIGHFSRPPIDISRFDVRTDLPHLKT